MSGCAGSSTDGLAVAPLVLPGKVRSARAGFFKYFAGQVRMDRRPGRIGFMSTQRRENRWRQIGCLNGAEVLGFGFPDPKAGRVRANANGGTAPPIFPASFHPSDEDLSPGTPERLATNSLQSGYRIVKLVQFVLNVRRVVLQVSPPFGAGLGPATGMPTTHGLPPPHLPSPSGLAHLHPALPQVPAG